MEKISSLMDLLSILPVLPTVMLNLKQSPEESIKQSSSLRGKVAPRVWEPSPAIAGKVKTKVVKYSPLMQIIHKFESDHILHSFVPFVVSSLGELYKEAVGFREELVFKHKVTSGVHPVSR